MNFLEQLAAEWYQYNGYFVRTNIRFGKNSRGNGGYVGEIDLIAYQPMNNDFIHIEASTDATSWANRKKELERKFTDARGYYPEIFPFKTASIKPKQIAIVGFNLTQSPESNSLESAPPSGSSLGAIKIDVIHIPKFIEMIRDTLKDKDPQKQAVPETFPLLRAIQYSVFYM